MSVDKSAPGGDYYKGGETTPGGGYTFDSDGDGVADQVGYDTDGDGVLDTYNIDTNGDQWTDTTVTDWDGDGYADDGSATVYHNEYDTGQNPLAAGGAIAGDGAPAPAAPAPAAPASPDTTSSDAGWVSETFDDATAGFEDEVFSTSADGTSASSGDFSTDVFAGGSGGSEAAYDPTVATTGSYYDSNGDGYADAQDAYNADGEYVGTSWDTNQDGIQDLYGMDTDGDGGLDTYGLDANNDGDIELIGYDHNQDGVIDEMHSYDE